ncbi:hypothetical protein AB0I60_34700 [Actinosynnema sp. NPDC050436]|uniref:hypothetical protein n=1 Tax=Actinosynnema sp. NPDC050436 TaxID=3155659 RepID=UPI0033D93FB8
MNHTAPVAPSGANRAADIATALLVDAENVIGPFRPRVSLVRARLTALLAAAGHVDHALVAFADTWPADDTVPSALAELGAIPWPVPEGPDAAETALAAHARYLAGRGRRWRFLVASADHRLAQVAEYGELHVLAWTDHPVSARLEAAATTIHRLPRTRTGDEHPVPTLPTAGSPNHPPDPVSHLAATRTTDRVIAAIATGAGIALTHRLLDHLLPHRRR